MNLQDTECLKFSVASTFQEPPVANFARPSDPIKYFHYYTAQSGLIAVD